MKVAILGYGVEGQSSARYWQAQGAEITICDANPNLILPEGFQGKLGESYLEQLEGFDLVVRSQSIHPNKFSTSTPVTSVTNEFMAQCPAPVIGVTGTKGKGTTSSLVAKILEASGRKVHLGGNIGTPALDFLSEVQPDDFVVLELASYQTMDMVKGPQVGICVMVAPEHLNWHTDLAEYLTAKGQMFAAQAETDLAVFNARNDFSREIAGNSPGIKQPYLDTSGAWVDGETIKYQETVICRVDEIGLLGPHNLENICAAITATWGIVGDPKPMREAIMAFRGLPHRLEFVREINQIRYYDDSFSTTPETAIAAIRSFEQPKVVILGGSDKGSQYQELAQVVARSNVRGVIAIGEMAGKIEAALQQAGFDQVICGPSTMSDIIDASLKLAQAGDIVLLSPACASFDLFKDYKDRGNQFQQIVQNLSE